MSNEKNRRAQVFAFSPEGIDSAVGFIDKSLQELGLRDSKDVIRIRLSAEEILLNWKERSGLADSYNVELFRRLGQISLTIRCAGQSEDPLAQSMDDSFGTGGMNRTILANMGLAMSWNYQNGENVVFCAYKPRRKLSQPKQIGIAVVFAFLLGNLCLLLPERVGLYMLDSFLDPVFNTFIEALSCIVSPVMLLSVIWGIVNMGDTRQLGKIGGRLLGKFFARMLILTIASMVVSVLFFPPKLGLSNGDSVVKSLVETILDIIPSNIVEPFATGNTLQILFMGMVIGVTMIILGERLKFMGQFVEQANTIVQRILTAIGSLLPFFIFIAVFRIVLQGTLAHNAMGLLKLLLVSIAIMVVDVFIKLISLKKYGLSIIGAMKKIATPVIVALTTASSSAAFLPMKECGTKKLGIDEKMSDFAFPLGSIVYMPHCAVVNVTVVLFAAQVYDVELSIGALILCIVNAIIIAMAAPPVPGGAISCYALMFLSAGIPLEAISLAVTADIIFDFVVTAANVMDILVVVTHSANGMGLLNKEMLKQK